MTSIVEVIQHYQRSIDNSQNNEARLLHCINKLHNLPIKVEHLQETGVGKTVNSLRKFNGEIGVAAKALVTKWKAMVAAEEEPMDTTSQTNESETHNDSNGDDEANTPHDDEADENHNRNINSQEQEEHKHRSKEKKDKHKDKHKDRSSSGHKEHGKHSSSSSKQSSDKSEKHKSSSSSSSKEKESHSSKHKDKEREKEKIEHKSSKDKHKDQDKDKEKERSDKKREEKDKSKSDKEHSSSHKSSSSSKSKHDDKHSSSGHSSSSSSKEKERSDKHKSSSKDKERSKEQEKPSSSSTSTSSKDKPEHKSSSTSSTSKSSAKDSDSAERKRRHNSDNDSSDFKSPQPKVAKVVQKSSTSTPPQADEDVADDSFDSSMGANFDDVLGMLNVPLKKSKKSLKSPSTPTASSSSSSKKDRPSSSSSSSGTPLTSSSSGKVNGTRVPFSSNNSTSSLYSTPSSSKSSTMKPDLLAPTAKLEPLDPSIALELPTISTNYKPMPLNQTVMDCVFNNSSSSSRPVRTLTDAEAITHGISSKTMRTKIYSGVRTGQTYQVPTLFDMCIRILQKNIDALEYTGGVPFEVLKPVLERATPQQLYVFEDYNPYLMEDSDVLWQQHVSRTYRTKKRLENESWREMFIRCQEEEERRLSVLKDSIKASQKIAAAPVRKTQLAFVDSMVKPPRNVAKKQEQYGTKSKMIATPAARVAALSNVTPNAAKVGDQRLRVPSTARDHAQVSSSSIRPKKAPLMQKTLQFIRGRHKR